MGYFQELPNLLYQSPLSHKNTSSDYIVVKNIFRRTKLADYLKDAVTVFQKFVIGDGDRPDTIASKLYGDSRLDYIIILTAGISNINHEWPLQDHQVFDYALEKYGSQENVYANHHYETFEIRDDKNRQILPPKLIVDIDFKIDGTPGKENTFSTLNPGAPLVGFKINFAFSGIHAIFCLPSLNSPGW